MELLDIKIIKDWVDPETTKEVKVPLANNRDYKRLYMVEVRIYGTDWVHRGRSN